MPKKLHVVFLADLQNHSEREVCMGAAEYAAERADWSFDPWASMDSRSDKVSSEDLLGVDGILATEPGLRALGMFRFRTRTPRIYFLADRQHRGAPYVSLDEVATGEMAAEHLLTRGYPELAFVGSSSMLWSQMRGRAFAAHGKKAGVLARKFELPLDQLPVFWSPRAAKRQHDLEQIVTALRKPCGIFAANDVIACFVLQAAREKGYRVPEDIGVLGVDDDPVPNAAAGLSISSIHPPFREVGLRAAELLGDLLKGAKNCSHVRIAPVRVVVRTSTDVFVTNDPLLSKAQRYIEERRQGRILVGELTRALGTNAVTLGKHFQRTLDVGIREYIEKRRLEYATVQLRLGKMNVDEVTDACGFSSASYFSRVYKRVTGNSPGRVRGRTS